VSLSLFATAGVLGLLSLLLVGPASTSLSGAAWVSRAPRAAVALWQSIGVSAGVAAIGAGLCVAVARFDAGFLGGLADLGRGLVDGHPLRGLGLPDALGLTLAADLGVVLLVLLGATMVRTVAARSRHRRLLTVLAGSAGTVLLDHPGAVAYCLPGLRPRIVVSAGTIEMLAPDELAAVIDHERGHAHEHHGLVMLPMSGLRDLFGWIPYARLAPRCVAALLEMAADDYAAARNHSPAALASALVQMSSRTTSAPCCAFAFASASAFASPSAAGTGGVPSRVARLLCATRTSRRTAVLAGVGVAGVLALPVVTLLLA
jgi:Zn-dependent protease with chaperone function